MKATFNLPDELYRSAKARSALEGRTLRSVVIELFQNWLKSPVQKPQEESDSTLSDDIEWFPWLATSQKYLGKGVASDMESVRESIEQGWASETSSASSHKRRIS